jgi:hypothetical protein
MLPENREEGAYAVRSSPFNRNYKTGEICRKEERPTNTDCQNIPTQHRLNSVTDSKTRQDRITDRKTEIKDSIAEKTKKDGKGRGCTDNCHVTWMKS